MKLGATLLVGSLAAAAAGCAAIKKASGKREDKPVPLVATIVLPEAHYADGRLYATISLDSYETSGPVTARLDGPGLPGETFAIERGGCEAYQPDKKARWNTACSWPIPEAAAQPGTFHITVSHVGKTIGESDVALIELPAAGGRKVLAVDPAVRTGKPYVAGQGFRVWFPIDARYRWREVQLYAFPDGKTDGDGGPDSVDSLRMTPMTKPGDPAIEVAAIELAIPAYSQFAIVALRAGSAHLGAWKIVPMTDDKAAYRPYQAVAELSDELSAAILARSAKRVRPSNARPGKPVPLFGRDVVARVCAMLASAPAGRAPSRRGHAGRTDCFAKDRPAWLLPEPMADEPGEGAAARR